MSPQVTEEDAQISVTAVASERSSPAHTFPCLSQCEPASSLTEKVGSESAAQGWHGQVLLAPTGGWLSCLREQARGLGSADIRAWSRVLLTPEGDDWAGVHRVNRKQIGTVCRPVTVARQTPSECHELGLGRTQIHGRAPTIPARAIFFLPLLLSLPVTSLPLLLPGLLKNSQALEFSLLLFLESSTRIHMLFVL